MIRVSLRPRELMCAACRKYDGKAKEHVLWVLRDKSINCRGQEMTQSLVGLESW